ncbi:fasciclin domain-containing protein [Siphonobacter curvatus]|uniref:Fasciclin n=1 Tax=Siphonobacter curvatus TaxID=2094562 RepID=A0A2S7IQK1_9BACT|nr:fasciclin domain-containing protein [Siphonobacter curvatus]PQA59949.1 fasciclin [Siphonobacter curvatus]
MKAILLSVLAAGLLTATQTFAQQTAPVDAAKKGQIIMSAQKMIVENAVQSPGLKTFTAALKQTGVSNTLSSSGPFTVFAPTDSAFSAVPDAAQFVSAGNVTTLRKTLLHHVVTGKWTANDLQNAVNKGKGKTVLRTLTGQNLTVTKSGDQFVVADEKGHQAVVEFPDQAQKNGVVHVISAVLMPK